MLAPLADIVNVTPDPRNSPVGEVIINFTDSTTHQPTAVFNVDQGDFTLTRDNVAVSLTGAQVTGSGDTWAIDLASVTTQNGAYVLTLKASGSGIVDGSNVALASDAIDSWTIQAGGPIADIVDVSPDPRNTPVGLVTVHFTDSLTGQPTSVTGVDTSDFSLTRNNSNISLAGAAVTGSDDTWAIDLSNVTTQDGTYVLTLKASGSGIIDGSNQALASDAADGFTIDATNPTADIVDISPDPRTTFVGNVTVNFSESVTGVDISDFNLTRNGTSVSLAGLTVNGSGSQYTVNLASVTSADGSYVLTLVAANSGIVDAQNNPLTVNASDSWVINSSPPTATFTVISTPRNTSVASETINFDRPVTGVDATDFSLTRNGATVALTGVTVTGIGSSYTINNLTNLTATAGAYALTLNASTSGITDSNGLALATNATVPWVMDITAPTAAFTAVTPNPRTTPVGNVTVTFSEAVTGVDVSDFTLSRNGVSVSLAGVPVTPVSTTVYTINLSTVTDTVGNYVLTLVATNSGIKDSAGNLLATSISTSFSIDDVFENNDTFASAFDLGRLTAPVQVGPLSLIDANDWFRFTTAAKGTVADNVTITFQNSQGNLDLELYSVSGIRLKTSTGFGNSETISLNGLAAGTYNIRVYGKAGATNPEYTLTINAPRVPIDDIFENNDTRQTASNLGTFVSGATISDLALLDTHDWYRFTTTSTGTAANSVSISFVNALGNLDLELYNANGTRVATSTGSGNTEKISLSGRPAGTYFIDVLGKYSAHNVNYSLSIAPPSTAAFNIQFGFDGLTASQISTVELAADKWQHIIIGDLPSASYIPFGATTPVTVDDVQMDVFSFPIDGVGNILGGSAPDAFRSGSSLPIHGDIVFDSTDLAQPQVANQLYSTALHEMAHVLGFGSIWTDKGLLNTTDPNNPVFTGAQAVAEYNTIFGTAATGVPVDNSDLEGTADAHWDESILGNELMTGFLNVGDNPLSKITVASMADLGYTVNLNAADPYTKPSMLLAPNQSGNSSSSNQALHIASPVLLDALIAKWQSMKHDIRKWTGKA
ncbi:MAG TPA: pre-peptidase C-terminal domain-containing protein [Pirellulaceae bacterium]